MTSATSANRQFLLWTLALLLLAGYGLHAIWTRGLPWAAGAATRLVPAAWERELGESIAASIAPGAKPCLEDTAARLARGLPGPSLYTFRVRCVASEEVNALAAPGGVILVYEGLLRAAATREEIPAVLAHEMQHVRLRHSTRAIFRAFAIQAVISLAFGDPTGLVSQVAGGLGALHYMRADEEEADREGVLLLKRAGFDPLAMPALLESLDAATSGAPGGALTWISSHPDIKQRIATTRALARSIR